MAVSSLSTLRGEGKAHLYRRYDKDTITRQELIIATLYERSSNLTYNSFRPVVLPPLPSNAGPRPRPVLTKATFVTIHRQALRQQKHQSVAKKNTTQRPELYHNPTEGGEKEGSHVRIHRRTRTLLQLIFLRGLKANPNKTVSVSFFPCFQPRHAKVKRGKEDGRTFSLSFS